MNPVNLSLLGKKFELMWPEYGYFGQVACSIQLEKQNMPDSLFYLNQGRLSNKGSKKIFYGDYFKPDFRTFKST